MFNRFIVLFSITSLFFLGVAVGHYKYFPFNLLQSLRTKFSYSLQAPFSGSERFINHITLFDGIHGAYDVVFLGDSITSAGRWSELFPSEKVANRGIGGDTSEGILERIDQVIALTPSRVYLMFGINDIARGVSSYEIFSNYKIIISRLHDAGIQAIVQSTLLTNREDFNTDVHLLNELLLSYSKSKGIEFIDINVVLAPEGILINSYDGIHLNADAYLAWRNIIINTKKLTP